MFARALPVAKRMKDMVLTNEIVKTWQQQTAVLLRCQLMHLASLLNLTGVDGCHYKFGSSLKGKKKVANDSCLV